MYFPVAVVLYRKILAMLICFCSKYQSIVFKLITVTVRACVFVLLVTMSYLGLVYNSDKFNSYSLSISLHKDFAYSRTAVVNRLDFITSSENGRKLRTSWLLLVGYNLHISLQIRLIPYAVNYSRTEYFDIQMSWLQLVVISSLRNVSAKLFIFIFI